MRARTAWRALPALALGAAAAALLWAPSLHIPGHRGAARVVEGFVPGRWDARFVVARGPAALRLPAQALRATLLVSGPAELKVRTPDGEQQKAILAAQPSLVDVTLARGGRAELLADKTIRLHALVLTRIGAPSWGRLLALLTATLAAAALAFAPRWWAPAASFAVAALAAAAVLAGTLGALAAEVGADRLAPAAALLVLAASFFLPRLLPPGDEPASRPEAAVALAFGLVALASCLAQALLLPQPLVIGDPAAYHDIGRRFAAATADLRGPRGLADALQTLRPYGGLGATGLLYGLLLLIHDSLRTIYVAHALAMAGAVMFLVRAASRIGGRRLAVIAGLLALSYPTFPILCGIVQPEPVILLFWTLALDLLLRARDTRSPRTFGAAGLAFGFGLVLHPQGLWFLLAALGLVALVAVRVLLRPPLRAWTGAFLFGLLPVVVATGVGEAWARPATYVLDERHGFWAYTARMPLGFWLFIDTDGWQGPLRIDDTRYARGLLAAQGEGRAGGAAGRAAYTVRFVAENAAASVRTVLRNLHRLFEVPDNPFRRAWILPYGVQVAWHRALVVLFLVGVPLAFARRAVPLVVPVIILAATYPLYHVFNKYAVPATPFVLLGAAVAFDRLVFTEARLLSFALALGVAALGSALPPGDLAGAGLPVAAACALPPLLAWGGLAAAFMLAMRHWAASAPARAACALAGAMLLASSIATAWGDPKAREFRVPLDRAARHEIVPDADALGAALSAPEAWVFLDLLIPDGRAPGLRLDFDGGAQVTGGELLPTMPTFGLATFRGHRDPRAFRQWWAARFRPDMVRDGRVAVTIRDDSGTACIFGDMGAPRGAGTDRGLSLGQWPLSSVYRLMHDGEYRLPAVQPLRGSRSSEAAGRRLPGALGVRLVILDPAGGDPPWAAGPSPRPWRPLLVY